LAALSAEFAFDADSDGHNLESFLRPSDAPFRQSGRAREEENLPGGNRPAAEYPAQEVTRRICFLEYRASGHSRSLECALHFPFAPMWFLRWMAECGPVSGFDDSGNRSDGGYLDKSGALSREQAGVMSARYYDFTRAVFGSEWELWQVS
jgi:hypothetical protein